MPLSSPRPGPLLPAVAVARLFQEAGSGTRTGLLSVQAAAALRSVGLETAGAVFGCTAMAIEDDKGGYCDRRRPRGVRGPWSTAVLPVPRGGQVYAYATFDAMQRCWDRALQKLRTEAEALGADGVVAVSLHHERLEDVEQFAAHGTAVRRRERPAGEREPLWVAMLSGEDCAAALSAGLAPREVVLAVAAASAHADRRLTRLGFAVRASPREIETLTQLLGTARAEARATLTARAEPHAPGHVVLGDAGTETFRVRCGAGIDVYAHAWFAGTVLAPGPVPAHLRGRRFVPVLGLRPTRATAEPWRRAGLGWAARERGGEVSS